MKHLFLNCIESLIKKYTVTAIKLTLIIILPLPMITFAQKDPKHNDKNLKPDKNTSEKNKNIEFEAMAENISIIESQIIALSQNWATTHDASTIDSTINTVAASVSEAITDSASATDSIFNTLNTSPAMSSLDTTANTLHPSASEATTQAESTLDSVINTVDTSMGEIITGALSTVDSAVNTLPLSPAMPTLDTTANTLHPSASEAITQVESTLDSVINTVDTSMGEIITGALSTVDSAVNTLTISPAMSTLDTTANTLHPSASEAITQIESTLDSAINTIGTSASEATVNLTDIAVELTQDASIIDNAIHTPQQVMSIIENIATTNDNLHLLSPNYAPFIISESIIKAGDDGDSDADDDIVIESPQTVTQDFSLPENFLVTPLPDGAGCPHVLEYSRQEPSQNNSNYFFVGTDNGLFVFADNKGNGFDAGELDKLNEEPFINRTWQKVKTIPGAVIDIKTSGLNRLYVLTKELTGNAQNPVQNTLYACNFQNNIADMFNPDTDPANLSIIAQTNSPTDPFQKTSAFFGIQIISTGDPVNDAGGKEQLILATNQGLYKSDADQTGAMEGIADEMVTSQSDGDTPANWKIVESDETTMFTGIAGMETPVRYTVWPFGLQDTRGLHIFDGSSIFQLSGTGDATGNNSEIANVFVPTQFNALSESPRFNTLYPIVYFWTDGGRRLFIVQRPQDPYTVNCIMSLPFDVEQYNINTKNVLSDPVLSTIERFFWIGQVGATGLLMAGTNRGVVSLQ